MKGDHEDFVIGLDVYFYLFGTIDVCCTLFAELVARYKLSICSRISASSLKQRISEAVFLLQEQGLVATVLDTQKQAVCRS